MAVSSLSALTGISWVTMYTAILSLRACRVSGSATCLEPFLLTRITQYNSSGAMAAMTSIQRQHKSEQHVISAYSALVRRRGQRVYAPMVSHTCTKECRFWEVPRTMGYGLCFVCTKAIRVHWCGDMCSEAEVSPDSGCHVCSFTGFEISRCKEIHYRVPSKDGRTLKHDHFIRLGKAKISRSKPISRVNYSHIKNTISAILCGPKRTEFYNEQQSLIRSGMAAKLCKMTRPLSLTDLQVLYIKSKCRYKPWPPPLRTLDTPSHTQWVRDICTFISFMVSHKIGGGNMAKKRQESLCSLLISCLSRGLKGPRGVELFPRLPWLYRHCPHDLQFPRLVSSVQCKTMSRLWRDLNRFMVCSKTNTVRVTYTQVISSRSNYI